MYRKTVAVDLDGVLAVYDGWKGENIIGDPMPGAREFLQKLKKKYDVVIFTSRARNVAWDWVHKHDLAKYVDEINYCPVNIRFGKPVAVAYVDDRAVKFDGNFNDVLREVEKLAGPNAKKDTGVGK